MKFVKNCFNCKHAHEDISGFSCKKRVYANEKERKKHLNLMTSDRYLGRPKTNCFEVINYSIAILK